MLKTRKSRSGQPKITRKPVSYTSNAYTGFQPAPPIRAKPPPPAVTPKLLLFILLFVVSLFSLIKINHDLSIQYHLARSRLNIGIVILLTKDPGISGGFLDSITALSVSIDEAHSKHQLTKIALVHSEVTRSLPVLRFFGFQILSRSLPFTLDEIKNPKYAKELKTDGCCGPLELLKLEVWTLHEFDYVIAMDADMHFHANFEAIFDIMSNNDTLNAKLKDNSKYKGKYLGWTHGATADKKQELINGGFLVIRPNVTHYQQMYDIIKEGDFRDGTAWRGSGIGWCYGGRTIQGIIPFYYYSVLGRGTADIELDRCVYNNMVEIEKCRQYTYSQVISNHFTWCQKPWYCIYQTHQPLCIEFNRKWWSASRKVEAMLGLSPREECPAAADGAKTYEAIDYSKSSIAL